MIVKNGGGGGGGGGSSEPLEPPLDPPLPPPIVRGHFMFVLGFMNMIALCVLYSFLIISLRKRRFVVLLYLYSCTVYAFHVCIYRSGSRE